MYLASVLNNKEHLKLYLELNEQKFHVGADMSIPVKVLL